MTEYEAKKLYRARTALLGHCDGCPIRRKGNHECGQCGVAVVLTTLRDMTAALEAKWAKPKWQKKR